MFLNKKQNFDNIFYSMCYFAFDINHDDEMKQTYQETFLGAIYLEEQDLLLVPQGYQLLLRLTPQKFISLTTGDIIYTKINEEGFVLFVKDLVPYQNFSHTKDLNNLPLNKSFPDRTIKKLLKNR